jgi:glycosyltransferase involved in cell wall biosynthesis
MKIAFVRMMPYPYTIGGGTSHLRDLSRALIEEGHEVYIISAKPEQENLELLKNEKAIIINVGMRHRKFSGKLWKLPFEAIRRVFFELSFMRSSYKLVKKLNPDIVHCQTALTEAFPFALRGRPYIVTEHGAHTRGMETLYRKKRNPISGIGIWIYKKLEKFNIKRAGKLICISGEAADYYKNIGKECEVIGNGVFLQNIRAGKKDKRVLFTLSRISPEKGLDYLMDALQILDKSGLKFEFLIGGDGEKSYVQGLKDKASKLNNINVKFLGFVQSKKKAELLKNGSIFVLPSIFEGSPVTLFEAMANNCSIISSDIEATRKIVKPSFGVLVPFSDEKKRAPNLAVAISKSLKWDVAKMGRAARKEVEKYDYRKIVKKYIQIYKDFVAKYGRK